MPGANCRAYVADMALRIGANGYYPDVMVACEPSPDDRFEIAPCLVVEVLSPSTASIDRREKKAAYTSLPSLQTYVLADPDRIDVEVHQRVGERWVHRVLAAGDTLGLACPPVELSIDELHRGLG